MKRSWYLLLTFALFTIPAVLFVAGARTATPAPADPVQRGKYLVTITGCNDCHTPLKMGPNGPAPDGSRLLSGHPADPELPPPPALTPGPWFAVTAGLTAWAGPWGVSYAANLTPDEATGLGIWTEDMFVQTMRTGKHMGVGRDILPPMPWQNLAAMSHDDLRALFAYLRSIPAIRNSVPAPRGRQGESLYE